jgi:tagaturonate reductase
MVQKMNDNAGFGGLVQIVQPNGEEFRTSSKILNERGGRYHTCLRGILGGKTVEEIEEITCVRGVDVPSNLEQYATVPSLRFVVSNTTEAGIQYVKGQNTFPAKVLRLLKARKAAGLGGLVFIPCELIERNGEALKKCVLQHCADEGDAALAEWIDRECVFCSTLVDRIVAGRPDPESAERYAKQLGEKDDVLVCGEPFHFLAVQTPDGYDLESEFPLKKAGVNVVYTDDLQPYRTRKVRFLNATHTTMVYLGLEKGFTEVAQCIEDPEFNKFVRQVVFDEIFPTVDLPDAEKREFAESVLERFANPFAHHQLSSIALNTVAKWKTRCLPVICDYYRLTGKMPEAMIKGYEAIARHYDSAK